MNSIDIFCEVIDNFGDIGVVYRLANSLETKYSQLGEPVKIRVILDKTFELTKLDPRAEKVDFQTLGNIEFITYHYLDKNKSTIKPHNIIIEAFGCKIPAWYLKIAKLESTLLLNLEYLSCEKWALDAHLTESPLGSKKLKKFFFMPGLDPKSGGVILNSPQIFPDDSNKNHERLLNETDIEFETRNKFDSSLESYNSSLTDKFLKEKIVGTVFSYEHNFRNLLNTLLKRKEKFVLLVLGEKSQKSFLRSCQEILQSKVINSHISEDKNTFTLNNISICFLPFVSQKKYDTLLNLTHFNFVRGEDSFVRATLSGKPFLWQAYCQEEKIHLDKIQGFLDTFSDYFKGEPQNVLDDYSKIMIQYSDRVSNTFESREGHEDFNLFFDNLSELEKLNNEFSFHIKDNCDLVENLYQFIKKHS